MRTKDAQCNTMTLIQAEKILREYNSYVLILIVAAICISTRPRRGDENIELTGEVFDIDLVQICLRDIFAIGFSLAPDWLRRWREISSPITEHTKAKPVQSRITFDTQLKIALFNSLDFQCQRYDPRRHCSRSRGGCKG